VPKGYLQSLERSCRKSKISYYIFDLRNKYALSDVIVKEYTDFDFSNIENPTRRTIVTLKIIGYYTSLESSELYWLRSVVTNQRNMNLVIIFLSNKNDLDIIFNNYYSPFYQSNIQIR
ncbi:TPA: hypothetical protein ACQYCW_004527, partial [Vibrio parahaemolyticus]